eukprot:6488369-Amphidinium_carterae.3
MMGLWAPGQETSPEGSTQPSPGPLGGLPRMPPGLLVWRILFVLISSFAVFGDHVSSFNFKSKSHERSMRGTS